VNRFYCFDTLSGGGRAYKKSSIKQHWKNKKRGYRTRGLLYCRLYEEFYAGKRQ
jgi:hypothetical protein